MKAGMMAAIFAALATGGCMTTPRAGPVDVTRFHLGTAIAPGTISVEPLRTTDTVSPEYRTYAAAAERELTRLGYSVAPTGTTSQYIAALSFTRTTLGAVQRPSPFSIGLGAGGGSFGRRGGVGLGGGLALPIGRGRTDSVIGSELAVQIRRRADGTTLWEGRAVTEGVARADATQPLASADRLARAMFREFPGDSGITTTVR